MQPGATFHVGHPRQDITVRVGGREPWILPAGVDCDLRLEVFPGPSYAAGLPGVPEGRRRARVIFRTPRLERVATPYDVDVSEFESVFGIVDPELPPIDVPLVTESTTPPEKRALSRQRRVNKDVTAWVGGRVPVRLKAGVDYDVELELFPEPSYGLCQPDDIVPRDRYLSRVRFTLDGRRFVVPYDVDPYEIELVFNCVPPPNSRRWRPWAMTDDDRVVAEVAEVGELRCGDFCAYGPDDALKLEVVINDKHVVRIRRTKSSQKYVMCFDAFCAECTADEVTRLLMIITGDAS